MNKPQTRKEDVTDIINGISVGDPYRWLEDGASPEVKEWTTQQNAYVDASLKNDAFETFSNELVKNFKVVNFSNPVPCHGKYFYTERQPDEDQAVIYVKHGIDGESIKLVDPNGQTADNTSTIDFWSVSRDGKYMTYGLSHGGDEMATLYVKDVEANKDLPFEIPRCRYSQVRWLPDGSGFFYTRNPRAGEVPENEAHLHIKVYFHKLEENDYMNDELIFGKDRPKDDMIGLSSTSLDGRYLGITVSQTWTENDVYIYDRQTKELKPLVTGIPSKFALFFLEEKAVIDTNYKANNYRLLTTPLTELFKPIDEWAELLPESEHLLQKRVATKSKLIVEYLINATSKVFIFDHDGKQLGELPLPPYSSFAGISSSRDEEEFFYGVDSFTFPKITYHYHPETDSYDVYRKTDNPINPDDYAVKQEWFASKDGTKVPMFIFHRKDIDTNKKSPTILYGYGGFGNTDTPGFMRNYVPWLERGGIFAIANIRGNGEFGEVWHKGGIKENKQNTFDDFISAGEYLIAQGYTDRDHLGIMGGSNGGLLTAAVAVQRPDLFKAVCSRVPLTDMVRFPLFGIASRWVHEYDDPQNKEDLERIMTWSPYHNVKEGVEYPAVLFTTGIKDTRVDPLHARKMAAILQSVNKINPVYIFTEMEAGHGPGKPIKKIVENTAIMLTFFSEKLDLEMK
jgi:prolyl oligopeptidase